MLIILICRYLFIDIKIVFEFNLTRSIFRYNTGELLNHIDLYYTKQEKFYR